MPSAEAAAKLHNNPKAWNQLWDKRISGEKNVPETEAVYERIFELASQLDIPEGALFVDVGGGRGDLANHFRVEDWDTLVIDHSFSALKVAGAAGHNVQCTDLEERDMRLGPLSAGVAACTEVIEHLTERAMHELLGQLRDLNCPTFISVPNNVLGPDEEPQHARKLTTMEFLTLMREYWPDARIEYFDPWYQLAICNGPEKLETVSVCFPACDEAGDIERVLKSFRPVADEIVVGVDPRSTDETEEIARRYAEKVFTLEDPQGTSIDGVDDPRAVHFAWIRNQCIEQCTMDWIFMTEAHEELAEGHWAVLKLSTVVPPAAQLGMVFRTAVKGTHKERWGFPWLMRRSSGIRYVRRTHNIPDYPPGAYIVQLPKIVTLHDRAVDREKSRAEQRKAVSRKSLMEDWIDNKNEASLFYLGTEWRHHDPKRGVEYIERLLALPPKNGPMRYQARLALALTHMRATPPRLDEARKILARCVEDDWSRTEHWMWLGDIAFDREKYSEALQWYLYASVCIGNPPFTMWWIDLCNYTYMPAQRLAMCYSALSDGPNALKWAEKVVELLPEDVAPEMMEECVRNRDFLREALGLETQADEENEHGRPEAG